VNKSKASCYAFCAMYGCTPWCCFVKQFEGIFTVIYPYVRTLSINISFFFSSFLLFILFSLRTELNCIMYRVIVNYQLVGEPKLKNRQITDVQSSTITPSDTCPTPRVNIPLFYSITARPF
jgi:hypothetical protein